MYGGEPGGGKSDLLIGLPRREHKNAALFRRTYPRLEDTLIKRSREMFGASGAYNSGRHEWKFEDGCEIKMRHLEAAKDMYDYASAQFDFLGFDELTEFDRLPYEFLFSRVRSGDMNQRCRIVSATNWVGEGLSWVFQRWAAWIDPRHPNRAKPGELRWFRRDENGRDTECDANHPDALSRTFIPAGLKDNAFLDAEEYRKRLASLPEPYRTALLDGDPTAGMKDGADQLIPSAWLRAAMNRWQPREPGGLSCLGVDVAREGNDKTVLCPRYGNWFGELASYPGSQTPDGYAVINLAAPYLARGGYANVDVIGIGSAVVDLGRGKNFVGINFAEGTKAQDRTGSFGFSNKRAEAYWRTRELLDPDRELSDGEELPQVFPDDELFADLTAPKFKLESTGIRVEKKDDIKKRLGRSPDKGDAFALSVIIDSGMFDADSYIAALRKLNDE